MNIQSRYSDNIPGFTSAGVAIAPVRVGASDNSTLGHTLTAGTYYFPIDTVDDSLLHCTLKWNAAFAATITLESTDFPAAQSNQVADVTDWSSTAGDWEQENPTTAYVPIAGTGNSVTNLTITAGGTNAGGASVHLGNMGARRLRWKVVCGTGGLLRIADNAKRPSAT
jgi:hypothetical protein